VALDLTLVIHAADREAEVLLLQCVGDGDADTGLSDSGRADQADDGTLGVLLFLAHGQKFENSVLDVLHPVMVPLKNLSGAVDAEVLRLRLLPRKIADDLQVGAADGVLRTGRIHCLQAAHLAVDGLLGFS